MKDVRELVRVLPQTQRYEVLEFLGPEPGPGHCISLDIPGQVGR